MTKSAIYLNDNECRIGGKNMILKVTVEYKGMQSSIEIDLDENQKTYHYLEEIKKHVETSKKLIDDQQFKVWL